MDTRKYLGQEVEVVIDRAMGSKHPKHGFTYEVNYGYVPGTKAPDGEEIDAYLLGVDKPVEKVTGKCIAIIQRTNDDDDKLVVVSPDSEAIKDAEIERLTEFQEKWFKHRIIRE